MISIFEPSFHVTIFCMPIEIPVNGQPRLAESKSAFFDN